MKKELSFPSKNRERVLREALLACIDQLQLSTQFQYVFQKENETWSFLYQKILKRFSLQQKENSNDVEKIDHLLQQESFISHFSEKERELYAQFLDDYIFSIVKTTLFIENPEEPSCISFRFHPAILWRYLPQRLFPEVPYAFFYVSSIKCIGIHVRFANLARGGLRTVYIENREKRLEAQKNIFQECYQLAVTQEKKNKDIPEGGSKGIIFVTEEGLLDESASLFACQKLYIKEMLRLVNWNEEQHSLRNPAIIDYVGLPEYLYLGPDERMSDEAIEWISSYAQEVGYRPGAVFMTSKPRAGINHKEYGVTSQGLMTWLVESMKTLFSKDLYRSHFSLTMTGGPDGDVASNIIKILYNSCRKYAHFLAIKDKSGIAYDPEGLDIEELYRLAHLGLPIEYFRSESLSDRGWIVSIENGAHFFRSKSQDKKSGTEYGQLYLDYIFTIQADLFLPAGGRPGTLSSQNIHSFFQKNQAPSTPLIIEGANLFITQDARDVLEKKAVFIVKDSSANKGGVISSSYEVLCGLILSEKEFMDHKSQIVTQIIDVIHESCLLEAKLLFSLIDNGMTKNLVASSMEISRKMLNFRYTIALLLQEWDPRNSKNQEADPFLVILKAYLLPFLRDEYFDRVVKKLPLFHQRASVAAFLSSQYFYRQASNSKIILQDPHCTDYESLRLLALDFIRKS